LHARSEAKQHKQTHSTTNKVEQKGNKPQYNIRSNHIKLFIPYNLWKSNYALIPQVKGHSPKYNISVSQYPKASSNSNRE
jgi:hypothetical protein